MLGSVLIHLLGLVKTQPPHEMELAETSEITESCPPVACWTRRRSKKQSSSDRFPESVCLSSGRIRSSVVFALDYEGALFSMSILQRLRHRTKSARCHKELDASSWYFESYFVQWWIQCMADPFFWSNKFLNCFMFKTAIENRKVAQGAGGENFT